MAVNHQHRSQMAITVSVLFTVLIVIPAIFHLLSTLFSDSFKVHPTNADDPWVQHPETQQDRRPQNNALSKRRDRWNRRYKTDQSDETVLKPLYNTVNRSVTLRSVQEPIRAALQSRGSSNNGKTAPTYGVEVILGRKDNVAAVCRIQNACYDRLGNLYVHPGLQHNAKFIKHCVTGHSNRQSMVQMKGHDDVSKKQAHNTQRVAQGSNVRRDTGIRYLEDSAPFDDKNVNSPKTSAYQYNETDVWTSVDFFGDFIPHKSLGHLLHFAKRLLPHIMAVQLPDHLFSRCPSLTRLCLSPMTESSAGTKSTEDSTSCADHREVDRNLATVLPDSVLNARAREWMPQFFLRFKEEPIALSMNMLFPPGESNKTLVCFNSVVLSRLHRDRVRHEWIDSFHSSDSSTSPSINPTKPITSNSTNRMNPIQKTLPRLHVSVKGISGNGTRSTLTSTAQNRSASLKARKRIKTHVIRITVFNRAAHRPRHIANVHELRIAIDTALRVRYPFLVHHTVLNEVFYERMSFAQQVDAVRDANIVIVGHGTGTAAVSTALFSKPCTLMIELYPFSIISRTRRRKRRHYYARMNALDYAHLAAEPDKDTVFECLAKSTMLTVDRLQFRELWKKVVSQRKKAGNMKRFDLVLANDDTKMRNSIEQVAENRVAKDVTELPRHMYHPAVRHCLRKQNFFVHVRTMTDLILEWAKTFQKRANDVALENENGMGNGQNSQLKSESCRAKRRAYPSFEQCPISFR